MEWNAKWIRPSVNMGDVCPVFSTTFSSDKTVKSAQLSVTAMGVYAAQINGKSVGDFVLAPGWTAYESRLQVQEYDVKDLIGANNELAITVGKGWYRSPLPGWVWTERKAMLDSLSAGLTAKLQICFEDGSTQTITTDESWEVKESQIRFSEIYDGEIFDATFEATEKTSAEVFDGPTETLIPQQGEEIREQERLRAAKMFKTPEGDTVIDFGQEVTGYIEISVDGKAGEKVVLSFAEVMDKYGNFYTENYRSAKAQYIYTCKDGYQIYK